MLKFSILIPIYNVEQYLTYCLDSVINQTYNEIEIICVNDGSTDNSLKILEEYAQKDERIKIINQENQGVSVARNVGIENATGDYILFIDSDDWIDIDTCKILNAKLENKSQDLIIFNHSVVTNKFTRQIRYSGGNKFAFWAACYKSSIIKNNNIKFPKNIRISEDHFFKYNFLFYAKNIKHIDKYFYFYNLTNENSATKNYAKIINGDIDAYHLLIKTDFYQKSAKEKQLEMTDYWGMLLFGAWSSIPIHILKKDYNLKICSFLDNYKQFDYKDYKNLVGYKRLKNKWIVRFLKNIRDLFFNIIYRTNNNAK